MKESLKQNSEETTVRQRNIVISLSDDDCHKLAIKAGKVGLSIDELLRRFIGDLVDGTYTIGRFERKLADDWYFHSCILGSHITLVTTLMNYGIDNMYCGMDKVDSFVDTLIEIESLQRIIEVGKCYDCSCHGEVVLTTEQLHEMKQRLQSYKYTYNSIVNDYLEKYPNADITAEVEKCKDFMNQYFMLYS